MNQIGQFALLSTKIYLEVKFRMAQLETRTEPMVVNFGPHHPSMHGVLRLVVTLDGENVIDCEPVIGYLHRGMEKIAENRTNVMYVPYVSRMDYAAGMFYEAIVVLSLIHI